MFDERWSRAAIERRSAAPSDFASCGVNPSINNLSVLFENSSPA
jgi:hypothetical protein